MNDSLTNIAAEFDNDFEENPNNERLAEGTKENEAEQATSSKLLNKNTCLFVNKKQRGNPLLASITNVPWEYKDIVPDYQMGRSTCALFLSLRYHNLNPDYIHGRLKLLGKMYELRVLVVLVDIKDPHHALKNLTRICILTDMTLILAWSSEEAGKIIETYKVYENKPPDKIMEKSERSPGLKLIQALTSIKRISKTDAMTLVTKFKTLKGILQATEHQYLGDKGGSTSERPQAVGQGSFTAGGLFLCLKVAGAGNLNGGNAGGDVAAALLEWEDGDRFSFEDSDRFEEDSLCSWSSEPESVCNNWRGWKKPTIASGSFNFISKKSADDKIQVPSLTELAAKCVASHIPFELVEHIYPPVPEQLQLRIAFWSFPDNEEDIRLYSCLANGSSDEFARGELHHRNHCVKDPLQIGFHLSASVSVQQNRIGAHNVAVTFDRRRISSCNCTCNSSAYWCSHVVAVCLTRIHWPHLVTLRAPVSESLSRLQRDQLQKFAQYLISELPQQILPTAQRLLDELLGSQPSVINSVCGAPDPTAGASANDQTSWYLDVKALHGNIKKILIKFCVPAPIVFSDVNYLSTTAPPAAAEWTSLLRPLRGREPEGMWNLLSIVREMFKRNDRNAIPLLEIITDECMACEQILVWWFNTKVALLNGSSAYGGGGGGKHNNVNSNTHASQHACSSLCDEVVILWRLAALNPGLSPQERDMLHNQFSTWHFKVIEKVSKCRNSSGSQSNSNKNGGLKLDLEVFTGFKPAIEACYLDWDDYPMPGITYTEDINPMYHCPFTCFRHSGDNKSETVTQVNSSKVVINCEHPQANSHMHSHHHHHHHHHHHSRVTRFDYVDILRLNPDMEFHRTPAPLSRDGNRSSVSSEGFCENDDEINVLRESRRILRSLDFDSQEGGGSDSGSSSGSSNRDIAASLQHSSNSDDSDSKKDYMKNASTSHLSSLSKKPDDSETTDKDLSRRPSKDESTSSSNSGDEYNVYYYNAKDVNIASDTQKNIKTTDDNDSKNVFVNLKKSDDA